MTFQLSDTVYREAKAEAARRGLTVTRFIQVGIDERNLLVEELLQRTAHFYIGSRPTREEMNER